MGPRTPRSWPEHLDDKKSNVFDTDEIVSWDVQHLFKTCTPIDHFAEYDSCQIGMTVIVMERCQCSAHARIYVPQTTKCSLRGRCRNYPCWAEGSLSSFLRIRTTGNVYTHDHPQRFKNMLTYPLIHRSAACWEFRRERLGQRFWHTRIPSRMTVSFMFVTMLIAATGLNIAAFAPY